MFSGDTGAQMLKLLNYYGPAPAPAETSSKLQQLPDSGPTPLESSSKLLAYLQQTPATSGHL